MKTKLTPVQKIAFGGVLIVLNVLLTRLPGLAQVGPAFSFNRIGLGVGVVIFSSLTLGPGYGALVGVAGDALGWLVMGQFTGIFNFFLSIYFALVGVFPWLLGKLLGLIKGSEKADRIVLPILYLSLYATLVALLWGTTVFDGQFAKWNMEPISTKIVLTVVSFALAALTFVGLWAALRYAKRRADRLSGIPNPYRVGIICLLTEVFAILIKPLAFVLYCQLLLGQPISEAWHITYEGLILLNLLFGFADIPLNSLFVAFACIISKPFLRPVGPKTKKEE